MIKWIWGKPLIQNFSNQPQKGYTEVEPDAGVPFRRLQFTDIYDLASCSFDLDRFNYIRFMSWYKSELRQGTIPFEIFDCRYKRERTARIVGDVPHYATNSNRYTLNLTLAFMPEAFNYDYTMTVGDGLRLIVNDDNPLVAGLLVRA